MAALAKFLKRPQLSVVLLIGLGVRLIGLAGRPIWYDEAFSLLVARGDTLAFPFATDVHPPLYYLLLSVWGDLFGISVVNARLFSILFGLITIFLAYQLCTLLFNKELAGWSVLFLAVSPFLVHYAQEIRMYSLLTVFVLLAAYAFWRGSRSSGWRWWALFSLAAALAQYTHNLAVFFLFPLALWPLLARDWKTLARVVIATSLSVLVYLPWLVGLLAQFGAVRASYWIEQPGIAELISVLLLFVSNLPLPPIWLPISLASALLLLTLAIWHTYKRFRVQQEDRQLSLWLAMMAFLPMAMMFVVSFWVPVFLPRALLPSAIFFLIWIVWSLQGADILRLIRYAAYGILLVNSAVGIYMHTTYNGFPYVPYEKDSIALIFGLPNDQVIVHSNKLSMLPMEYLDADFQHRYIADTPGSGSDTLSSASQQALELSSFGNVKDAVEDAEAVWFFVFNTEVEEYLALGNETHPDLAWLEHNFRLMETRERGDLLIFHFETRD